MTQDEEKRELKRNALRQYDVPGTTNLERSGFLEGFDAGYEAGKAEGIAQGTLDGYDAGYEAGHAAGKVAGIAQGTMDALFPRKAPDISKLPIPF